MEVKFSPADIQAIADAVAARLAETGSLSGKEVMAERVLWREDQAAQSLGVSAAWLKRLRLRGYIKASTTERPILYTREQLDAAAKFLVKHAAGAD